MGKPNPNHHLMRVRMRTRIFRHLQAIAEEESERCQEHVTVSDLVRAACSDFIHKYESLRQLDARQAEYSAALFEPSDEGDFSDEDEEDDIDETTAQEPRVLILWQHLV
jgi:hypothetical protein